MRSTVLPSPVAGRLSWVRKRIKEPDNHHKVDNNEPPGKPPNVPEFGSYCIRAYANMVSGEQVLKEFTGFDEHMHIVDTVARYCEINKDAKDAVCNPTRLSFVGHMPELCDGRVLMYDPRTGASQTYYDHTTPFFD
jgi:hypothetical protein